MTVLLMSLVASVSAFLLYVCFDVRAEKVDESRCCCGCGSPILSAAGTAPAEPLYFCSLRCARLESGRLSFPVLMVSLVGFSAVLFWVMSGVGLPF